MWRVWQNVVAATGGVIVGAWWQHEVWFSGPVARVLGRLLDLPGGDMIWDHVPAATPIRVSIHRYVPALLAAFVVLGLLRRFCGPAPAVETRCRRCRHVLRGLVEPQCPECGERI